MREARGNQPHGIPAAHSTWYCRRKGVYTGKLKLEEVRPPEHYKMAVDGKGKQGFMRGAGTLDLVAKGASQTVVTYGGDIQIGGPLVASRPAHDRQSAKMMIGQFFAAAERS